MDEHPKPDTTLETLAGLREAFAADGTVTAGNASGINDGAAAVVLASELVVADRRSPGWPGWTPSRRPPWSRI